MKEFSDSEEESVNLLFDPAWQPSQDNMPQVIERSGLSFERQTYLYKKIRDSALQHKVQSITFIRVKFLIISITFMKKHILNTLVH